MSYIENINRCVNRNDNGKDKGIGTLTITKNGSYSNNGSSTIDVKVENKSKEQLYRAVPMYDTNEVNSVSDLVVGNVYTYYLDDDNPSNSGRDFILRGQLLSNLYLFDTTGFDEIIFSQIDYNYIAFEVTSYDYLVLYFTENIFTENYITFNGVELSSFNFVFYSLNAIEQDLDFDYTFIRPCQNIPLKYIPVEE